MEDQLSLLQKLRLISNYILLIVKVCFQWSEDDESYILEEKNTELDESDFKYNQLVPPPVVKFSW